MLLRRASMIPAGHTRMLFLKRSYHGSATRQKLFDRLLPEDDEETKKKKSLESQAISRRMQRSKLSEMMTANKEKIFVAGPELLPPASAGTGAAAAGGSGTYFSEIAELRPLPSMRGGSAPAPLHLQPQHFFANSAATLVTLAFQGLGQKQASMWHEAFVAGGEHRPVPVLDEHGRVNAAIDFSQPRLLNLLFLEGWFFRALRSYFERAVTAATDDSIRPFSALVFEPTGKNADHFCERLSIHNRIMAHAFLVDSQGCIRWRAHAEPVIGEDVALRQATADLILEQTPALRRR